MPNDRAVSLDVGYDPAPLPLQVPAWRILSVPPDTYACYLLIIGLPSYSTKVLYILG